MTDLQQFVAMKKVDLEKLKQQQQFAPQQQIQSGGMGPWVGPPTEQVFSGQGYMTNNQQSFMNANLASNVPQGSVNFGAGTIPGPIGQQQQNFGTPQYYGTTTNAVQGEVWGLGQNSGQNTQWGYNR